MLKFDLQIFADAVLETVQGSDIVYMYRLLEKASSQAAKGLAFTTENEESMSADSAETVCISEGKLPARTAAQRMTDRLRSKLGVFLFISCPP